MNELLLLGGRQRGSAVAGSEWHYYDKAVALAVSMDGKSCRQVLEHVTPPHLCADVEPSITFKAGTVHDGLRYACTQTELMIYRLADWSVQEQISLPCFNDVHHVIPTSTGTLLAANTGLDRVVEVSRGGEIINTWPVLDEPLWERFSPVVDYRKIVTTKPHKSHPNFVYEQDGDYWVVRHLQKDAICLASPSKRIAIDHGGPHDGEKHGEHIYFTTVNGAVVVANLETLQIDRVIDLNVYEQGTRPLGWCRGLHVLDDDRFIVGFSRLRPTVVKGAVAWMKRQVKSRLGRENYDSQPTHITCYNHRRGEVEWTLDLEPYGMNAIFSVLPLK